MKKFIVNRIFKSWKHTVFGIVVAVVLIVMLEQGIITLDSLGGFITSAVAGIATIWGILKQSKEVKLDEIEKHYKEQSAKKSDETLAADVDRLTDKR